jgi:hypothetical protein
MSDTPLSEFEREARVAASHGMLRDLLAFIWHSKKWWMAPLIITLMLLGVLVFLSSTAAAPFIYSLF